jgi:cysteine synthase A
LFKNAKMLGSVLYEYFTNGKLEKKGSGSITEGIGQGRLTENMKDAIVDGALYIDDSETISMVYKMLHEEGIFIGASSALNVCAAYQLAKKLGPGHTIVTVLCDGGSRYQSRLTSKKWLISKNLLEFVPQKYHGTLFE